MKARLLVGRLDGGALRVYPLLCMDCENDVFEWLDSWEQINTATGAAVNVGMFRCAHCGYTVILDEKTFLMESTDEVSGWVANRKQPGFSRTKRSDPLNGRAEGNEPLASEGQ